MNKSKTTLAAVGGVIVIAVIVMGYFAWNAYSNKIAAIEGNEETEGLEGTVAKAQTLSRKPIYPCAESVKATDDNASVLGEWNREALKLASRGDKCFDKTTPAAFKTFIVADAKRLAVLPGDVNGALVKPDFEFGPFKDYITEGKMPAEDKLAEIQRRWDDVVTIIEMLANCGIAELTGVEFKGASAEEPKEEENSKKKSRAKSRKPKAAAQPKSELQPPAAFSYVFAFNTRAAGLVKAINALSIAERYVVIDDFSFGRQTDAIAEALGGVEKKQAAQPASRRRGRRAREAAVEPKTEEKNDKLAGIVTDPVLDSPFNVTMTVTVYDFHSMDEEPKTEEKKVKESK